jgi:hypothetical protein
MADDLAAGTIFPSAAAGRCAEYARPTTISATSRIRGLSIIGVEPLAQAVPLRGVMTANDFGAGGLDAANFSK